MARSAATAGVVGALLIAPYLINCWRATGDPFYAVNYHTVYYRAADGLPRDSTVGAVEYLADKLARHPIATLDVAVRGLFRRSRSRTSSTGTSTGVRISGRSCAGARLQE